MDDQTIVELKSLCHELDVEFMLACMIPQTSRQQNFSLFRYGNNLATFGDQRKPLSCSLQLL
jgi:hypothetical protein